MTDDLRWAVRYAFLEDLWRDRPRVVVDVGLEAALRESPRARETDSAPLDALMDALVPRVPKARTWMAVADEAVARELAQTRPGTGFLPRISFADVVAHRDWAVALVELSALHDDAPGGTRLREQLTQRAQEGRTVVVSARSVPGQEDDDAGYAALSELLEELGGGRIYGVYRPGMAAVIDFGDEGESDGERGDQGEDEDEDEGGGEDDGEDDGDGDGDGDEVALSFDNTLGSQSPAFMEYVAVAGRVPRLPEGMTLVELPANAPSVAQSSDGRLRAQLVQAQRQAELSAIDRQTLLEKVDALESAHAKLEQQANDLRDNLARAVTEDSPQAVEASERLQASLADNQALRWKVQQLERQLDGVKARPVETLEAEAAALRAELEGVRQAAEARDAQALEAEEDDGEDEDDDGEDDGYGYGYDEDELGRSELGLLTSDAHETAQRIRHGSVLVELDRLIARVERGGIGVLPLRQALVSLRRRLRG